MQKRLIHTQMRPIHMQKRYMHVLKKIYTKKTSLSLFLDQITVFPPQSHVSSYRCQKKRNIHMQKGSTHMQKRHIYLKKRSLSFPFLSLFKLRRFKPKFTSYRIGAPKREIFTCKRDIFICKRDIFICKRDICMWKKEIYSYTQEISLLLVSLALEVTAFQPEHHVLS